MQASPPSETGLQLRPRSLSELLDEAFRLYRAHFVVLAVTAFVVLLPSLVISFLSGRATSTFLGIRESLGSAGGAGSIGHPVLTFAGSGWTLVSIVVSLLIAPFTSGAAFLAATEAALGRAPTVASVLRGVLSRYFPIWGVVLVFVVGGFALLVPPLGLWLLVRWVVAMPTLFAEGTGPAAAAGRSWALVRGRWWRTFGTILVATILAIVLAIILGALFGVVAALPGLGAGAHAGLVALASNVASALVSPALTVVVTLIYFDLRVRKEGIDLQQLAWQAGGGSSAPPGPDNPPPWPPPAAPPPPPGWGPPAS